MKISQFKSGLFVLLLSLSIKANTQDFLMQGWYWNYPKTAEGKNWADTMTFRANAIAQGGFTYVWLPPLSRTSSGNYSNGYDPKDLYDLGGYGLGPTGFGTNTQVANVISTFSSNNIKTVADVVYNHRDGGRAENNPVVQDYVNNAHHGSCSTNPLYTDPNYKPYPSDRFRYILPIGGATGNGAGHYYIKISSASGYSTYYNKPYTFYAQTNTTGYQGLPDLILTYPNGGGDCGEANMYAPLGKNIQAQTKSSGCLTTEYDVEIKATDFNPAGDTLFVFIANQGGNYSDHRIYGVWSGARGMNIVNEFKIQTYTDFTSMPSGQGAMNYADFHPNGSACSVMGGEWDTPYFYYDYDQSGTNTQTVLNDWTKWLWNSNGIRGYRMDAVKQFNPSFVSQLMNDLNVNGINPGMVVGEYFDYSAGNVIGWINSVKSGMSAGANASINVRAFDFPMRDALKSACDAYGYDVRGVFSAGIAHNGGSAYNAVTFVNNHDLRDAGQPIQNDPLLAYAYIFTDNSIGVPTMFYPDYFGIPIPNAPTHYLKPSIDSIITLHKKYIYGASNIDYLNYAGSTYLNSPTNYISAGTGAKENTSLIYQISGGPSGKDVIVAINFAGTTLKVDHQINTHGGTIAVGTQFWDKMKRSAFDYAVVASNNTIYMELPPRSFSIWVNDDNASLDVLFDKVNAVFKNGRLQVNWQTNGETNSNWFEVQASTDGTNFKTIGKLDTLAMNGNSSKSLNYLFEKDWEGIGLLSLTFFLLLPFPKVGKKKRLVMLIAGFLAIEGCAKQDIFSLTEKGSDKFYIRIMQVDKDGGKQFSKTVVANYQ